MRMLCAVTKVLRLVIPFSTPSSLNPTVSVAAVGESFQATPKFKRSISREERMLYLFHSQQKWLRRRTRPTNTRLKPRPAPYGSYTVLGAVFLFFNAENSEFPYPTESRKIRSTLVFSIIFHLSIVALATIFLIMRIDAVKLPLLNIFSKWQLCVCCVQWRRFYV